MFTRAEFHFTKPKSKGVELGQDHDTWWGVVAERLRATNSSSGDSVQQSVGSNPDRDTCVPEQDT